MTDSCFEDKVKNIALQRMNKNVLLKLKNKIGAIHIVGIGKQSNHIEVSFINVWWHPFIIIELLFNLFFSPIICFFKKQNIVYFIKLNLYLYAISYGYDKKDLFSEESGEVKVK